MYVVTTSNTFEPENLVYFSYDQDDLVALLKNLKEEHPDKEWIVAVVLP